MLLVLGYLLLVRLPAVDLSSCVECSADVDFVLVMGLKPANS